MNNPLAFTWLRCPCSLCPQVEVLRAEKLISTAMSVMGGKCDPLVELTTDGKFTAETKCLKSTDHPVWGETFWLLVQVGPRQGTGKGRSALLSGRARARGHILMAGVSLLLQSFNQAIGHF